jgi:hypothetical protein
MVISSKLEITCRFGVQIPLGSKPRKLFQPTNYLLWLEIVDIFQKIIDITLENKYGNQTRVFIMIEYLPCSPLLDEILVGSGVGFAVNFQICKTLKIPS